MFISIIYLRKKYTTLKLEILQKWYFGQFTFFNRNFYCFCLISGEFLPNFTFFFWYLRKQRKEKQKRVEVQVYDRFRQKHQRNKTLLMTKKVNNGEKNNQNNQNSVKIRVLLSSSYCSLRRVDKYDLLERHILNVWQNIRYIVICPSIYFLS